MSHYSVDIPFKSFEKETIIPEYTVIDWDLVVNNVPYSVAHMEGFVHTQGGKWGINDLWAWPRDEKPNYKNLIPFDSDYPVCWGIEYKECNCKRYSEHAWGDENEITTSCGTWITRNGSPFYFVRGKMEYSLPKAQTLIFRINEGPINFNRINWSQKLIGRKIWYYNQPAIISSVWYDSEKGYHIYVEPDGISCFSCPESWKNDPLESAWDDYKHGLFCDLLEDNSTIDWFR